MAHPYFSFHGGGGGAAAGSIVALCLLLFVLPVGRWFNFKLPDLPLICFEENYFSK